MLRVQMTCMKHPNYKGSRKPKKETLCDACDFIWYTVHPAPTYKPDLKIEQIC